MEDKYKEYMMNEFEISDIKRNIELIQLICQKNNIQVTNFTKYVTPDTAQIRNWFTSQRNSLKIGSMKDEVVNMDLLYEDSIAYHFWQEVVANYISLNVAIRTGTPVGIPTGISLKQALAGNTRELAYYCSEAYFTGIHANAPKEFNDLANMMIEKLHQERYWEIDMSWINSVKLQIERIRKMQVE